MEALPSEPQILTPPELAAWFKVHITTIYKLANKGDLPCFRIGDAVRFRRASILAWLAEKQRG